MTTEDEELFRLREQLAITTRRIEAETNDLQRLRQRHLALENHFQQRLDELNKGMTEIQKRILDCEKGWATT